MIAASTTEPPVGASTCASGSQVCTGHIGTLTAKAAKKAKNSSVCACSRQRQLVPGQDVEAAARLVVQVDQRDQHQQRAEQRVQEELERRIDPARAAPDADDDVHRDQRGFEEHVEQQAVERAEHADHQARQDQERAHVLVDALGDHLPADDHDDDGDERGQQHEPAARCRRRRGGSCTLKRSIQGSFSDELHRRGAGVEAGDQRQRDQEARERRRSARSSARASRVLVAPERQQHARRRRSAARWQGSANPCSCSLARRSAPISVSQERPELPGHQPEHAERSSTAHSGRGSRVCSGAPRRRYQPTSARRAVDRRRRRSGLTSPPFHRPRAERARGARRARSR